MTAQHLYTYEDPPRERDLERACKILQEDGVLAYPTDVNWAIGCDAASAKALDQIHLLKPSHPKDMPFALICASISMAAEYANIDHFAYRYLKKAWPGPYTVLLQSNRALPRQLKDKRRVVGIRIPDCKLVLAIVERYGRPLATTSVPALEAPHAPEDGPRAPRFGYEVFEALGHGLDLVLDLGHELPGSESTIIDLTEGAPVLVRKGAGDPAAFDL